MTLHPGACDPRRLGLRGRLGELQQSLSAGVLDEGNAGPLDQVRYRAEALQRDLRSSPTPNGDPVDARLENIRRRIEQLNQNLNGY
jgi:hypothetical protein